MKTDKELISLAAKACGKDLQGYVWVDTAFYTGYQRRNIDPESGFEEQTQEWNPLVDWGQALYLAAECELSVSFGKIITRVIEGPNHHVFNTSGNYMAEVCRVIVTAAAESVR